MQHGRRSWGDPDMTGGGVDGHEIAVVVEGSSTSRLLSSSSSLPGSSVADSVVRNAELAASRSCISTFAWSLSGTWCLFLEGVTGPVPIPTAARRPQRSCGVCFAPVDDCGVWAGVTLDSGLSGTKWMSSTKTAR